MSGMAQAVFFALVAALIFIATKVAGVAIEREYDSWAPELARRVAWLADFIRGSRQNYCLAEVLHAQHEEGKTGLYEAVWHLIGGLELAFRHTPTRIRSRRKAVTEEEGSFLLTESGDFLVTEAGDRILLEDGDGGHVVGAGNVLITPPTLHASGAVRSAGSGDIMVVPPTATLTFGGGGR